ncbi:ribosome maturation factor RimP [candidate division WOR-3 bacterium]|nr:ribosome maturation factor RimP [candidate division WOR-3 bacterium]
MAIEMDLNRISGLVSAVIENAGLRLYDLDYNDVTQTLRVYIDKEKGGITIGDCQKISGAISRELDAAELVNFRYTLEVSSPGVERVLKRQEHYTWAMGKVVEINTGGDKIRGYLRAADAEAITMTAGEGEKKIPYSAIRKAKVVEESDHGK